MKFFLTIKLHWFLFLDDMTDRIIDKTHTDKKSLTKRGQEIGYQLR